jgi:DNA-binding transcriptional ArsR family regulator
VDDPREEDVDTCDDDSHDHPTIVDRVCEQLPADDAYEGASELFGALADVNRLRIVDAIRMAEELCVSDIIEITGMSQSAVSHALKLLRLRRLVVSRREGRHIYYRLLDEHVHTLVDFALEHQGESDSPG